ncbi:MAG: ERF family protein [Patescibacteria group bacterium]
MSDSRDLAIRPVDTLIASAVEKNIDVEKLERLIDMRNKELARQAKLDYDEHFARMQLEYVPVGKGKSAMDRDGKNTLYKYCPLEDILAVYQPIISRHGFSYRWSEETISPTEKRMWCIVAGYGHEERSYVDIPIQPPQGYTNVVQQRGSATTYGKRYSFIDAFGVIIGGEDDDATGSTPTAQSRPAASASSRTQDGPDEYDARIDHAVKSGKLTEAAADTWRDRLAKPASRKAAEDWIKANTEPVPATMSAGKAAAVEAEIVDESLDAAAEAGFGTEPPQDGVF